MSKRRSMESVLERAKGKEKSYDWLEAAKLYEHASAMVEKRDHLRMGEIQERISHCLHRAAFQAESREEFTKRMRAAINAYEKARRTYDKSMSKRKTARAFRCGAIVKHLEYWLTSDPPEKRRLLESVKEEQQLALSLTEALHAPAITSTTSSFSSPTPTYEEAVGLEVFEHAHVQANFFVQEGEINVGEDVALEIEMVNAGKGAATLVKVEDIVPAEGFKVVEKPEMYRVEDSYLNMRGKKLDPLKTEDVKLIVKPRSKGSFKMNPRILYLDETGKYKSHEPEPVMVTVKELGIRGWIKGER